MARTIKDICLSYVGCGISYGNHKWTGTEWARNAFSMNCYLCFIHCMSLTTSYKARKTMFSKAIMKFIDRILRVVRNKSLPRDEAWKPAFLTVPTVCVLCWRPGVLQTGKPWGAISVDVQHLGPRVRWELENIPNDTLFNNLSTLVHSPLRYLLELNHQQSYFQCWNIQN